MPIQKIPIEQFLQLAKTNPVFDVRSPGEYAHAHIQGSYPLPLFTDAERTIVGTAYKQQGKQKAIKLGLDYFGVKMKAMVEEVEALLKNNKIGEADQPLLVHCWRGGMRSAGVAWLLDLYGYKVYTLAGGYKAYRNWVLAQFTKSYNFKILGGYTGSGKTGILHQLHKQNHPVIDLEGLAKHKGSAFGGLGTAPQPSQEMFENLLAENLFQMREKDFWIEDESQRIGVINIPGGFWKSMRTKPVFFLDIPFEERLKNISKEYGVYKKEQLVNAVIRIQKRLGPLETKTVIGFFVEDNYPAAFEILLAYYDKTYKKSLLNRENIDALLNKTDCLFVDSLSNTEKLLSCATLSS